MIDRIVSDTINQMVYIVNEDHEEMPHDIHTAIRLMLSHTECPQQRHTPTVSQI